MLTRRRLTLLAVAVLPLLLPGPASAVIWLGPDAPPGDTINWAENYAQQTSANDPSMANRVWYGESHTRSVGPIRAGHTGFIEVPKYVAPSPEFRLEAVILTLDGNSGPGWHILQNKTATIGPSVTATLEATVEVFSNTSLSQLSVLANPLVEKGTALMPNLSAIEIPDPGTDPGGFMAYVGNDPPDDHKLIVSMDPPIAFHESDAADANTSNLSEWEAAGPNGAVVVLDWYSTADATASHTTNNVDTIVYPPMLAFLVNVTYVSTAPEPLSLVLFGAASLPLLAVRRRRKRKLT